MALFFGCSKKPFSSTIFVYWFYLFLSCLKYCYLVFRDITKNFSIVPTREKQKPSDETIFFLLRSLYTHGVLLVNKYNKFPFFS